MKFLERQFKNLDPTLKKKLRNIKTGAEIEISKQLEFIAKPSSELIAEQVKKAGQESIGPWIATGAIILALLYVSKR